MPEIVSDLDLEAIAKLISEGNTSGRLDYEDENGETVFMSWDLKVEKWKNN